MFEDLFVRVAAARLAEEAEAIAAGGAGPEIYFSAADLPGFNDRDAAALQRTLAGFHGHTVHAPFMDIVPGAADGDMRQLSLDKMRRTMDIAAGLGSRLVVMHFNYDPIYYRVHFDDWLERAADFFASLLAAPAGPLIALENIAEPTPQVARQLLRKAASPRLVHCFDFGHHHVFARIPFGEWLLALEPRTHIHFHLHDNHGDHDDHLALGQGSIDWPAARAEIAGLSCPFSIALEPKSSANRRQSLAYYRTHFLAGKG
jgi:sugar phosphate isomerase/epimerase